MRVIVFSFFNFFFSSSDSGKTLTVEEKAETGAVKSYTYHMYIQATGGYLVAIFVFLTFFLNVGSSAFSTWWLAVWIKAGGGVSKYICYI